LSASIPAVSTAKEVGVFTLSIEHAITDFPTWRAAFDRFSDARSQAGVLEDRIRCPVDDPRHLVIELDFETQKNAEAFREFLITVVWANPDASPALVGAPTTRILTPANRPQAAEVGGGRLASC
jgi:hypothetical protein